MRTWQPIAAFALIVIVIILTVIFSGDPTDNGANELIVSVDQGGVDVRNGNGTEKLQAGDSVRVGKDGSVEKNTIPDAGAGKEANALAAGTVASSTASGAQIALVTKAVLWITGHSLNEQDKPLEGTVVKLYTHNYPSRITNAIYERAIVSAKTNEEGYYAIQVPGAGKYYLDATPRDDFSREDGYVQLSEEKPTAEVSFKHSAASLSVKGKVIDKTTQQPVAGAVLQLDPYPIDTKKYTNYRPGAVSGPDGHFVIDRVKEGTYSIEVEAKGYEAYKPLPWRDPTDPLGNITVSERTQAKEYLVELKPGGSVLVRVFDPEGKRLPDISVVAAMQGTDLLPKIVGRTNTNGEYQFDTLPKGKGLIFALERPTQGGVPKYGLTLSDLFETGTVDEPAKVDIVMTLASSISGRVTDSDNQPMEASVIAINSIVSSMARNVPLAHLFAKTDSSGNYTIHGVGVGTWEMTASREGREMENEPVNKKVEIKADEHLTGIDFIFGKKEKGETIRGAVKDQFGEPVTTARLYTNTQNEKGELVSASGKTDENGEFEISGLTKAPNVQIGVFAEGYKSHNEPHKMDGSYIEITLMKGGSLEGIVLDKDERTPIANVQLRLDFQSDPNVEESRAVSEGDGHFKFENLQPGFYKIIGGVEGYSRYEQSKIELTPGDAKTGLVVEMERGVTFIGQLTGPQGAPVPGASVGLLSNRSTDLNVIYGNQIVPMPDSVSSDPEGIFMIQIPSEGSDTLVIIPPKGLAPQTLDITAQMVRPEPVAILLGKGGTIEGSVFNAAGEPVSQANIRAHDKPNSLFPNVGLTDSEGQYRIECVPVGKQFVEKQAERGASLSNETKTVTVAEGQVVRVDFGSGEGAIIQGTVTKGYDPAADAQLILEGGLNGETRMVSRTDESGHYQIKGVPEGEYTLLCTTSQTINYIGTYNADGFEKVTVVKDQNEYTVNFSLNQKEISGIVLDAETGEPIPNVVIQATNSDRKDVYLTPVSSDESGQFKIVLRYPGSYTIQAAKVGYQNATTNAEYILDGGQGAISVEFRMNRADCMVEAHLAMPIEKFSGQNVHFSALGVNPPRLSYETIPDQPYAYLITGMEEGMLDLRVSLHARDRSFLAFSDPFPVKKGETSKIFINFFEISNIDITFKTSDGSVASKAREDYRIEFEKFPNSQKLTISPSSSPNMIQIEAPLGNFRAHLFVNGYKPVDFIPEALAEMEWGPSMMKLELKLERQ